MEENTSNNNIHSYLSTAYALFKQGDFLQGIGVLEKALAVDFEHKEVVAALKCANFWSDRQKKIDDISDIFQKAEFLLRQWRKFLFFLKKINDSPEQCVYSIRQWLFGNAITHYTNLLKLTGGHDSELLFRTGKCHKGIGDYGKAIEFFEEASRQKRDDASIIAELADCYALINETKAAKVLFRESFFINPQKVDIFNLESLLIQRLIERLMKMGYSSPQLEEWLPVYAVIYGVFNIKRELKPLEYGKLKQSIFQLEGELESINEKNGEEKLLIPRLINRYFWLIDHYMGTKENREMIESILLKLKKLDSSIHEQYIN